MNMVNNIPVSCHCLGTAIMCIHGTGKAFCFGRWYHWNELAVHPGLFILQIFNTRHCALGVFYLLFFLSRMTRMSVLELTWDQNYICTEWVQSWDMKTDDSWDFETDNVIIDWYWSVYIAQNECTFWKFHVWERLQLSALWKYFVFETCTRRIFLSVAYLDLLLSAQEVSRLML